MNYWDSVGRWINTLLVFVVGILAFDALFRILEANEGNVIVSGVRVLSVAFLIPFQGMFGEQEFVLTTLIGVLGYALLAGIALGVLRSLQASRAQPAPLAPPQAPAVPTGDARPQPRPPKSARPARRSTPAAAKPATDTARRAPTAAKPATDAAKPVTDAAKPTSEQAQRSVKAAPTTDHPGGGQQANGQRRRRTSTPDPSARARRRERSRDRASSKPAAQGTPDVDRGA